MAILPSYGSFRHRFAVRAELTTACTFVPGSPATITGAGFDVAGFTAGQSLDVSGTGSNDGRFTLANVVAATLTLSAADTLVADGPIPATLLGVDRDWYGLETWPLALVRAAGFDGGITTTATTFGSTVSLSANAFATDAVAWTDEYDWYVSQRTDDPARQYLTVVRYASHIFTSTRSGSITLAPTALAKADLGFTGAYDLTSEMKQILLSHVHAYVRRISDGAIQWVDVSRL